jgi:hypothetical protein
MAATLHLQSAFSGLSLKSRQAPVAKKQPFISNGSALKLSMASRNTFQVEVRLPYLDGLGMLSYCPPR